MSRAGLDGGDDSEMGLRAPRERYWDSKRYWKGEPSPRSREHSGRWEAYSELKSHVTQHAKPPRQVPEVEHQTHQKSEQDATDAHKGLRYAGLIFTSGLLITLLCFALLGSKLQTSAVEATSPGLQHPEVPGKEPAEISKWSWFRNFTHDIQLRVASYASTALHNTPMPQRKGTEGKPASVRRQLTGDIVCDGYTSEEYCDCGGDCSTHASDWCSCSEAQACCDATLMDSDSDTDHSGGHLPYDSCSDSCPYEPSTCDEFTAMTLAGGCASSCTEEFIEEVRAALGCSESTLAEEPTLAPTVTEHVARVEFVSTLAMSEAEVSTAEFQDAYKQAVADAAGILEYYVRIINIQAGSKRRRAILQGGGGGGGGTTSTTEIATEALFVNSISDAEAFASSSLDTLTVDTVDGSYTAAVSGKTLVLAPSPPPAPIVSSNVWQAAKMGSMYEVIYWVQAGANVNKRYEEGHHHKEGSTALQEATWAGWYEVVEYLLDNGAHVNMKDADKFAPIHYAAKRGHEGILKLLISRGGRVNARNKKNETPLHLAADTGRLNVVKMLLAEKKIDVNGKNYDGRTPLDLCKVSAVGKKIYKLLKNQGALKGNAK